MADGGDGGGDAAPWPDPGVPLNEGIPGPVPDGPWSWSGILATTVDMYGGVGGQMMAEGGITGMPDESTGGSGSWTPGANGGGDTQTPPNRENELTNPNGLPSPRWTPGHGGSGGANQLARDTARAIANAITYAPRQINSMHWGIPGFGWSNVWPVDPYRVKWFGPKPMQIKADKYQTMPTKHRTGEQVDPYFEIHPSVDWTNDFNVMQSPYEYYDWPFPDNQITPIVTHRQAIDALRSGDMNAWYDYMNQRIPGPANPLDENWPGENYYWGAGDFANS